MCRFINKIKYGDTSKSPKYISTKGLWLYKNKFMSIDKMLIKLDLLYNKDIYNYEIKINGQYVMDSSNNFDQVLDKVFSNPLGIRFPYPEQYSAREMNIISQITNRALQSYINNFKNKVIDYTNSLNEEINETNAKIEKLLKK